MEIVFLLVAILVVAGITAAVVVTRRRSGDDIADLGPPPGPAPVRQIGEPEVDEQIVAEVEEALAPVVEELEAPTLEVTVTPEVGEPEVIERPRFRDRLSKARTAFAGFLGRTTVDQATWDELEDALILADVGVGLTGDLLDALRARVKEEGISDPGAMTAALKTELKGRLAADRGLRFESGTTNVWLFVGVNGVGKTTTIGKVGRQQADDGRAVVMAAGDTFRAAAAEQLGTWAERCGAHFVRGSEGADPSSVVFDAVEAATARGAGLVLADTAGRLHTKSNLMDELRKVRRVAEKGSGTVTEVLLVLDATTGQNGLVQAREFTSAVEVTGVVLTKLDGSAKGGIVLAIQHELGIPVKLVGLGESAGDLVEFDPEEFVEALLS
jgi:fused signal recognition particle receptor